MYHKRRRFYLVDRANGARRRNTLQEIADHFNGDGDGPVRWNKNNVDLERFKFEADECGYHFIIPLDDWKTRRAEQYVEAQMELAKKLREAYRLANTMWRLADERTDIAATRAL